MIDISKLNFEKLNGLTPAVIIDYKTDLVLMLGFMNKESLEITIETKLVTFYSRTRKELWTKGKTSGNYLRLVEIKPDCDNDSLLIYAEPDGNTCHTGNYSCFNINKTDTIKFIEELSKIIKERKERLPENSYTTKLFKEGENRIIQKFGEESVEVIIAAKNNNREEIINEVSDLIYHLLVLLEEKEIKLSDISANLEKRHEK
jgi:phosphoribosyl-AMP cyclohydrolase / phosphoribosyl-ATP pyrophosphohydrolase